MEISRHVVIAYLANEAAPHERIAVDGWRAADPANEREFLQQSQLWQLIGELDARSASLLIVRETSPDKSLAASDPVRSVGSAHAWR